MPGAARTPEPLGRGWPPCRRARRPLKSRRCLHAGQHIHMQCATEYVCTLCRVTGSCACAKDFEEHATKQDFFGCPAARIIRKQICPRQICSACWAGGRMKVSCNNHRPLVHLSSLCGGKQLLAYAFLKPCRIFTTCPSAESPFHHTLNSYCACCCLCIALCKNSAWLKSPQWSNVTRTRRCG